MAKLNLRAAQPSDVAWIAATEGKPEFYTFVGRWTEDEHRRAMADADVRYLIAYDTDAPHEDQRCGFAILRGISLPHHNIELKRFVIAEPERGVGQATLHQVMQFVFADLGAHRLWLDVFMTNERAQHVYRKLGFQQDGVFRESIYRDGVFHTLLLMSILDREFHALHREAATFHTD